MSFDHAEKWDNKVEKYIKGLDILKHMPKITNFHVTTSPPYSNMGGKMKVLKVLHTSIHLHCIQMFYMSCTLRETFKVHKTIT
jgi:hypothetical protein